MKMHLISKKSILTILIALCFIGFQNVLAKEEVVYTNQYGVSFTQEQYDFFTAMFHEGYQDVITKEMFDSYELDAMHPDLVKSKIYVEYLPPSTRDSSVSSSAKTLKISNVIMTECTVGVSLNWTKNPTVRSYDVMGAYLKGLTLTDTPFTTVTSSSGNYMVTDIKKLSNGFGTSIKLPDSGSVLIDQTYTTSKGGRVYASYQHAATKVTLAQSQNYTIAYAGLGHVFDFASSVWDKYDGMEGVYVDC